MFIILYYYCEQLITEADLQSRTNLSNVFANDDLKTIFYMYTHGYHLSPHQILHSLLQWFTSHHHQTRVYI
jgi:hypothetical protein